MLLIRITLKLNSKTNNFEYIKEIKKLIKKRSKTMNEEQLELWKNLKEGNTLGEVQEYIRKVIGIRGFSNQSIEQTMLLLTEEIGELAKAIRKEKTTMSIDNNKIRNYDTIESEVADVFIVLCTICNKLDIDLFSSLKDKEKENIERKWKK